MANDDAPTGQPKKKAKRASLNRSEPGIDRRTAIKTTAVAGISGLVANSASAREDRRPIESLIQISARRKSSTTPIKKQAMDAYQVSLQNIGGRLSNPIDQLFSTSSRAPENQFTIAIIGSGYGASICAARLAEKLKPEHRICILERGKEWIPGTFPDAFPDILGSVRQKLMGKNAGMIDNQLGLYNVLANDEINTVSASALGGTSVINANVALKPDPDVFQQLDWPSALRDRSTLDPYFERSAQELGLSRSLMDSTPKMMSRRIAANNVSPRNGFVDRSPLTVMLDDRHLDEFSRNRHQMIQPHCTGCGDCITGCNVGSKNTLAMNYLPKAKWAGTEIYTQVEVKTIEKCGGYYQVHLEYHDSSGGEPVHLAVASQMVILAAGSPASAHVLLQSAGREMQFSNSLGTRWTYNGDGIGFVIDSKCEAPIGGTGAYASCDTPVGPTVQTSLVYDRRDRLEHRLLIQDAAVPRGFSTLFSTLLQDPSLRNSSIMLAIGHDGGKGNVVWKDGRWQISWPGLRDSRYRKMVFNEFDRLARAHGGWYKQPKLLGDKCVSVHPLGGCRMADDATQGVVNDRGQVFDGQDCNCNSGTNAQVHRGLYVADGSIMPSSLGVNPFMTICAVTERIAEHISIDPNYTDWFVNA